MKKIQMVRMVGRNPECPTSRKPGLYLEQRLELIESGLCSTLTTVTKDNLVLIGESDNDCFCSRFENRKK